MSSTQRSPAPVAFITGAGSGIGRATAVELASNGYRLVLVGRRLEPLRDTAAMLRAGSEAIPFVADVGSAEQIRGAIEHGLNTFGRLDALINNAGLAPLLPIDQHTPAIIDEVFRVNALAPAYAIRAAWPIFLRQRSGRIVNISTLGTIDPFPGFFAYAAAKAAVNLMAKSCHIEGRVHGIRAFAVAPGAVETKMLRAIIPESALPKSAAMSPDTVARVIADCARGLRDAESGQTITVTP
jgi:NAD(P)-dependent dehydrogenase (short-subunit alcohol dehydrogenase family)